MTFIVRVSTSAVINHLAGSLYKTQSTFFVFRQDFDLVVRLITISITRRICRVKKHNISGLVQVRSNTENFKKLDGDEIGQGASNSFIMYNFQ